MGSFNVYNTACVFCVFFSRRFRSFMHFVWRHSIFTVIAHTIVKASDAKIKSQLTKGNLCSDIVFVARDFQFFNKILRRNFEQEKIICVATKEFTENLSKKQFHCTTMAPRRGKKAAPTVQAEAVVADSANDAVVSNGTKSAKSAPAAKENPKKVAASKKKVAEQIEHHEQENGGGAADSDAVEPVSGKAGPKSKPKKNAKATEQKAANDAGKANGQATNGDALVDGKKRTAKGKQKKTDEEAAPVKETKAAKGKPKKGNQEAVEDEQNAPEPGPSNVADKKKGKATKNVEPVEEVVAKGRGRGAKKPVAAEEPAESAKPVKGKGKAKNADAAKATAKGAKSKQNGDKPAEPTDENDEQEEEEEEAAPTKGQGRKRAAPATEKSPAKKGKKDANTSAAAAAAAKPKANGTPNKKRKAGVKAAADSTTDEPDGGLVTKRSKKASNKEADSNAESESKMNPTESDLSQIDFETDKEFTLKIVSWNVAGLRALVSKNGMDYFAHEKPDIICLQVC